MATQRGVGYVYIIKSSGGYCKVGKSHDPEGRLLALQSGNAYTLHLSHKIESDDYGECETFFHDILRHYRLRPNSEWFDLPEYLVDLIQGIPSLNLSEMTVDERVGGVGTHGHPIRAIPDVGVLEVRRPAIAAGDHLRLAAARQGPAHRGGTEGAAGG